MSVSTVRRPITFNRRAHDTIDETIVAAVPADAARAASAGESVKGV